MMLLMILYSIFLFIIGAITGIVLLALVTFSKMVDEECIESQRKVEEANGN